MLAAADAPRVPVAPSLSLWDTALVDYRRGMIFPGTAVIATGERVTIYLTRTYQRAWSRIGFTAAERTTINLAAAQIAVDMVAPMPSTAPLRFPREPLGGRMGAPVPGVTMTWLPHPDKPETAVLMTLDRRVLV